MPAVTTTRSNLAWTLLLVRNGSAPTMEDPPACSLDAILATLFSISASTVSAETTRGFDDLLQDILETANGGTLPTIEEAPPYSLEKIFWNLCLVENGSAPTIHPPMDCANEQLLANLALSTVDITTGLEMHLKLDDAADIYALDSSGNNKQGIITIAGATWGSGKINGGMEFDGVSGQLTFFPDSVVLGTTWTISGWLKPNSQTATYGAIATNGGASAGLWYQGSSAGANAGKLSFYYNSERRSTIALNNNEWNHFVLVNDAGTLTYYINNVAAGTYAGSGGPYNIQKIGSDLVNILKGAVDDFRVYSIALNEDQIAALFHYTEAPPTISAETQQFIDRLITPPAWVMERAYAEFIDGLVNAGLWTKLDALYLMPVNDPSYSMVNLMQDRFPLDLDIVSNNIAFTANSGWLSDGNGARIITPEKLLGAANLKCSLNDMCLFVYTAINSALSGVYDVRAVQDNGTLVEALSIYTLYTGGFVGGYVNSATESYGTGATNGSGMFIAQRVDSTHQDIYRNNVVVSTTPATANSTAFPDAYPGIWPWRRPRVWGFGKALNGTERGALQTLIEAFVTKRTGGTP